MTTSAPNPKTGYTIVFVGLLQYALILWFPLSPWAYSPLLAGVIYGVWLFFHPTNRYHRYFLLCISASIAGAVWPTALIALFGIDTTRVALLVRISQSGVSPIAGWLAAVLLCFDYRQRNPKDQSWITLVPVVLGATAITFAAIFPASNEAPAVAEEVNIRAEGHSIAGKNITIKGDSHQAGGDIHIQHGISEDLAKHLIDRLLSEKDKIIADRERQIQELKSALNRVAKDAAEGNSEAQKALQDARKSGDATAIQAHLIGIAQSKRNDIATSTEEYIAICKEIAAIAMARADLPVAGKQLREILRLRPNDGGAWLNLGNVLAFRGKNEDAEAAYRKVLELSGEDSPLRAFALSNLGTLSMRSGNIEEAKRLFHQAMTLGRILGSDSVVAGVTRALGQAMLRQGQLDEAEKHFSDALDLHHKVLGSSEMALDYLGLGHVALARGDLRRAKLMFDKADSTRRHFEESPLVSSFEQGLMLTKGGKPADAKKAFQTALKHCEALGMPYQTAVIVEELGKVSVATDDYDLEHDCRIKMKTLADDVDTPQIYVSYLTAIAGAMLRKEETERADKAITEAIEIGRHNDLEGSVEFAHAIGTKGLIYRRQRDFELAAKCHTQAFESSRRLGYLHLAGSEKNNLGMVKLRQDNLNQAEQCFAEALEILQQAGATESVALAYKNLAVVALKRRDEQHFRQMQRKAANLYRKVGNEQEAQELEKAFTILDEASRWGAPEHKIRVDNGNIVLNVTPSLCFSSDGRWLAGGTIGKAYLWDARTSKQVYEFRHEGAIVGMTFAMKERVLVTASANGTIRLWDLNSGKQKDEIASGGNGAHVGPIDFSRIDGLLVYSDPQGPRIGIYEFPTKQSRIRETAHKGPIAKLDIDEEGKRVITGGVDGSIRVWCYKRNAAQSFLGMHDTRIIAVKALPDQALAISISEDGIARTWDLEEAKEISSSPLGPHDPTQGQLVTSAAFSEDARTLVIGYANGDVGIINIPRKHLSLRESVHQGVVLAVAASADGRLVASAGATDGTVCIWQAKDTDE